MSKKDKVTEKKQDNQPAEEKVQTGEEKVKEQEKTEVTETKEETKEDLLGEIEKLNLELAAAKNAYYRAYADADNLKKRLMNEAENANKYRIQSFALSILPAIDSLERALDGKDESDPFVKGVKLTYDQIMHALNEEGVTVIECVNKPFDANYHHALMTEKVDGVEAGQVVEVLQKGYMLKDRLLRAALVKVSE